MGGGGRAEVVSVSWPWPGPGLALANRPSMELVVMGGVGGELSGVEVRFGVRTAGRGARVSVSCRE